MAAYAAVVSLTHILDLIKNHPSPPISLDKQQVDSLTEILTFLQEFLEGYVSPFTYSDEADPLEIRIADAAYAAEDVIESYIVDNIHLAAASTTHDDDDDEDEQIHYFNFYEDLQKVTEAMDLIKKDEDVMESYTVDSIQLAAAATHHEDEQILYFNFYEDLQKVTEAMDLIKKEAMGIVKEKGGHETELPRNVSVDAGFKSRSSERKKSTMVGFETIAREYFQELVDRNLVLVLNGELRWSLSYWDFMYSELGLVGNTKLCKMHDLLRDLSLREAKKQRFYHVVRQHYPPPPPQEGIIDSRRRRRIVIGKGMGSVDPFEPMPYLRSFVCLDPSVDKFSDLRLLRTLHTTVSIRSHKFSQADVSRLVNSRLLAIGLKVEGMRRLASSISQLWSLHTLIVYSRVDLNGPVEFWDMHQLKHVEFTKGRLHLQLPPPPPNNDSNIVILENLHTLIGVKDFHLNEDVVTRIPNLRILDAAYGGKLNRRVHSMSYLQSLSKLESFRCSIEYNKDVCYENLQEICFPRSLKQIFLREGFIGGRNIELEDILQKAGWLPLLEELGLLWGFFKRGVWKTSEGQFPRLKVLKLYECHNLRNWTVSGSSCFPLLQKLSLTYLEELEEIPSEIGEIATLKSIELTYCSESVVLSAKKIVEEQEDLYGEKQTILSIR